MIQKFRTMFDDGKIRRRDAVGIILIASLFYIGSDVDLPILQPDPHVISALLKTYLRECKTKHDSQTKDRRS